MILQDFAKCPDLDTLHDPPPQIIIAGLFDLDRDQIAGGEVVEILVDEQIAVDFGGVGHGAAGGALIIDLIHDDLKGELGDVLFSVTALSGLYGWTLDDIMTFNVEKLDARAAKKEAVG